MSEKPDLEALTWAMLRHDFGEYAPGPLRAVVPWGGSDAILVTDSGVYHARADERIGFTVKKVYDR